MLRQFWKKHPTYNLNVLMRKRYEELMDAKAFFALHSHCTEVQLASHRAGTIGPVSQADYSYYGMYSH